MSVFNKFKGTFQASNNLLQRLLENYLSFSTESKQLILGRKTVLLLCQQAISRVEKLKNLEPDVKEGLIATVEHQKLQIKVHFTPEKITLYEDCIKGELRLLTPPQFESDSLLYRTLIASWKIFLGGKLPNGTLPEEVKLKGDKVYYTLSRNQLDLLDALLSSLKQGSSIIVSLKQGELILESSVALTWKEIKFEKLLKALNLKS